MRGVYRGSGEIEALFSSGWGGGGGGKGLRILRWGSLGSRGLTEGASGHARLAAGSLVAVLTRGNRTETLAAYELLKKQGNLPVLYSFTR